MIANKYAQYKEQFTQRNDMHTQMIEQAASDRVLFLNESNRSNRYVDLRFPEYVAPMHLLDICGFEHRRRFWAGWKGGAEKLGTLPRIHADKMV